MTSYQIRFTSTAAQQNCDGKICVQVASKSLESWLMAAMWELDFSFIQRNDYLRLLVKRSVTGWQFPKTAARIKLSQNARTTLILQLDEPKS